jgi:hypothetical protein
MREISKADAGTELNVSIGETLELRCKPYRYAHTSMMPAEWENPSCRATPSTRISRNPGNPPLVRLTGWKNLRNTPAS